jgi:hypothetical protein
MQVVHLAGHRSTEAAIRAAQGDGEPVLVSWGAYCQLGNELGGARAAQGWLRELVAASSRPIAYSAPSCDRDSETHVFTPPEWSEEHALGWLGGFHQEVKSLFGSTDLLHEHPDGSRTHLD